MTSPNLGDRYRNQGLLGVGGMGRVYLAHDLELNRRVAIKRLTPRPDKWDSRRKRFRQEARITASLDHPAVVRVYDVYQDAETDYIVMEFVAGVSLDPSQKTPRGTSLHELVHSGPSLSLGRVLRLGRQIADGMAAAHEAGIIHRDLKSENVLVDRANNARITDFGIAKILGEDSMTEDGIVIGTYKAMSPEQAQGKKDVDTRTDLFSFGILLYESLAGTPPFTGSSSAEIINAILHGEPKPLAALRPELPQALLGLVHDLLQKPRDLRPAGGFAEVGETLNEIADALADEEERADALGNNTGPGLGSDDDETLSVDSPAPDPAPENPAPKITTQKLLAGASQSAEPAPRRRSFTWLGLGVLGLAVLALAVGPWRSTFQLTARGGVTGSAQRPRYIVVDEPKLFDCGDGDKASVQAVQDALTGALIELEGVGVLDQDALRGGAVMDRQVDGLVFADEHLSVSITCRSGILDIRLKRQAPSRAILQQHPLFQVEQADLGRSDTPVRNNIQVLFSEYEARTARFVHEDVAQFLRLRQAYWQKEPGFSIERVIAELASIRERSPTLLDVYRFEAELWRHRYISSRDEQHYQQAWSLLAKAREIEPSSPLVLSGIIILALDHGNVSQAGRVLAELSELSSASGLVLYLRARIEEKRGNKRTARDWLEKAAQEYRSWRILYHLASMEMSLGMLDEAREHLDQLLKLSPGNIAGEELQVCIELITGESEHVCQNIDFSDVDRVNNCAAELMADGYYNAAAVMLERSRELEPERNETAYNLGEALLLSGRDEEAASAFDEVASRIKPNAEALNMLTIRAQALAHLRRVDEARQTIEVALARSPDDVDIRYAAAATYALIEDREEAIRWMLATPTEIYDATWFSFPWFDFVKDDPQVRERLAGASTTPR